MDEQKILEKIAESAREIEIPDAVRPSQMKQKLKQNQKLKKKLNQKREKGLSGSFAKKGSIYRNTAAAACLCLCFGAAGLAFSMHSRADGYKAQSAQLFSGTQKTGAQDRDFPVDDAEPAANDGNNADADLSGKDTGTSDSYTDVQDENKKEAPLKRIGKMYTLASGYGEVYDVIKKGCAKWEAACGGERMAMDDAGKDVQNSMNGSTFGKAVYTGKKEALSAKQEAEGVLENEDYSKTNLQVEGVDESDIVKMDGSYIYVVQNAKIQVLDIRDKAPERAGTIEPLLREDTDEIKEMYVSGSLLTLIVQSEKSGLQQEKKQRELADVYFLNTDPLTKIITYDITNPQKAVLKDTTTQDGWYLDSRKIGSRMYLFTNKSMYLAQNMRKKEAVLEKTADGWIPCVGGKPVSADCIYLPEEGNEGIVMSSIDLAQNHIILDTKLLVHNFAQFYVTEHSVYLYYTDYVNGKEKTRIARFALGTDGTISAKAASVLKGSIQDTFAIYEQNGYLQVLTSVMNSDPWENRVYVLDENMETVGKLTGLAKGERIYAARFTGSTGYFVTYRNTDPLFTVDFSNPREPKIIGELKVTGFSDYLHFWTDQKMLGIGQETDAESGEVTGIKLSMFDISDPASVKEEGRIILKDTDDCEAMNNYKAVLADPKKNVIAFTTESWGSGQNGYRKDYHVFSYQNAEFIKQMERSLVPAGKEYDESSWRSVYAGNVLYLVSEKKTVAFDMEEGFKEIGKVKYAQ